MSPDDLRWGFMAPQFPGIHCLYLRHFEVARVQQCANSPKWVSTVARHRQDWRRQPHAYAATRDQALRSAERWTRANFASIVAEMPRLVETHAGVKRQVFPETNSPSSPRL